MDKYDKDMLPELFADLFTPSCNIHNHDTWKSAEYNLYHYNDVIMGTMAS